mmetsp:Transcript_33197/g.87247  ORF Transcript_33197/g.87247 Transcript_33197/m.87247 type:complete len:237 (-) Transcript_33197:683-1393(-)
MPSSTRCCSVHSRRKRPQSSSSLAASQRCHASRSSWDGLPAMAHSKARTSSACPRVASVCACITSRRLLATARASAATSAGLSAGSGGSDCGCCGCSCNGKLKPRSERPRSASSERPNRLKPPPPSRRSASGALATSVDPLAEAARMAARISATSAESASRRWRRAAGGGAGGSSSCRTGRSAGCWSTSCADGRTFGSSCSSLPSSSRMPSEQAKSAGASYCALQMRSSTRVIDSA